MGEMKVGVFRKRLMEMMDERGMRQTDLAAKTGIDKGLISGYVHGRYEPKEDKLNLLASALNCDPLWLIGYDGIDDDQDKTFMEMFRSLSAEDKKTVTKILQYLTKANKGNDV